MAFIIVRYTFGSMGDSCFGAIWKAIAAAKARTDKPALIRYKAIIGYGPPSTANSHDAQSFIIAHYACC